MTSNAYMRKRNDLYRHARSLIESDSDNFAKAGYRIWRLFSNKLIRREQEAVSGWSGKHLRLARITRARQAAIASYGDESCVPDWMYAAEMDFGAEELPVITLDAARMSILAIVLSADPQANEYISPEICPLAVVPWVYEQSMTCHCEEAHENCLCEEYCGREWGVWSDEDAGWTNHDGPPPSALGKLELAIEWVLENADPYPHANKTSEASKTDDLRPARWFSKATEEGLNPHLLLTAQRDGRLLGSEKQGHRWHHSINAVLKLYPDYREWIESALQQENPRHHQS